jgi:hypothetical protein
VGVWLKLPVVQARVERWPNDSALAKFGVGATQIPHLFMALMVFNNSLPFFGMVVFTLSWHGIVDVFDPAGAADKVVTLIGSLVLFMSIYPPSRLVFVAEAWLVRQSLFSRITNLVFFFITLLAALASVTGLF